MIKNIVLNNYEKQNKTKLLTFQTFIKILTRKDLFFIPFTTNTNKVWILRGKCIK